MGKNILFIGATGYIGSTVLDRILKVAPDASISVLVRNPKTPGFESIDKRLKTVKGSLEELDKLTSLAAEADIIINTADADGLESTKALLAGAKQRKEKTGETTILIHTSGTGTLSDHEKGNKAGTTIYTDAEADPSQNPAYHPIAALNDAAFHRDVDLTIVAADKAGDVKSYIILPSTIYGLSKTPFADAKLANPQSQQMPLKIRIGLARGKAAMIGKGDNLWPNVHIHDCADLFALVYKFALEGGEHGAEGYFFAENGEYRLGDADAQIGKVLFEKGLIGSPEPVTLSEEELRKYTGGSTYLGTNSRARGVRSRRIGWNPKFGNEDFFKSLEADVEYTLQSERGKKGGEFHFPPGPVETQGGWKLPGA